MHNYFLLPDADSTAAAAAAAAVAAAAAAATVEVVEAVSYSSFYLVRYFFGGAFMACDLASFYAANDQAGLFAHVLQASCNFFFNGLRLVH
jgi:hypothetical protein